MFQRASHNPSYDQLAETGPVVDYCVPINHYFPSDALLSGLRSDLDQILTYYPRTKSELAGRHASLFGVRPDQLLLGNGSTELIMATLQAFSKLRFGCEVPTFGQWTDLPTHTAEHRPKFFTLTRGTGYAWSVSEMVAFCRAEKIEFLALCNPNNPTGCLKTKAEMYQLLSELRDLPLIVVDESFMDFAGANSSVVSFLDEFTNLLVIKSLGKTLGLHGARIGVALGNPALIRKVSRYVTEWNVNGVAAAVLDQLHGMQDELQSSLTRMQCATARFGERLAALPGLDVFPTGANFVCCFHPDGQKIRDQLFRQHRLFIRECSNKVGAESGLLRIATREEDDQVLLVDALRDYLA